MKYIEKCAYKTGQISSTFIDKDIYPDSIQKIIYKKFSETAINENIYTRLKSAFLAGFNSGLGRKKILKGLFYQAHIFRLISAAHIKLLGTPGAIEYINLYQSDISTIKLSPDLIKENYFSDETSIPYNSNFIILGPGIIEEHEYKKNCIYVITKPRNDINLDRQNVILFLNKKFSYLLRTLDCKNYMAVIVGDKALANKENNIYHTDSLHGQLFGNDLALVKIIRVLSKYKPNSIELFGFDLYLSNNLYSKNYITTVKKNNGYIDRKKLFQSLWAHDMLYNFSILKFYHSKYSIEVHGILNDFLNKKASEYLRELELIWGTKKI